MQQAEAAKGKPKRSTWFDFGAWAKRRQEHEVYFAGPRRRARAAGAELTLVQDNTRRIRPGHLLVLATLRNEQPRMPFFLAHYRRLGAGHFLFVDNGSTDGFRAHVRGIDDVSVWHTEASYRSSNFGVDWINHLLGRFGHGHWCLTVDPDEILVYPYCESRNLLELIEFLEMERRDHLFCLLLDMYGPAGIARTTCLPGQNPLEVAPYFDCLGYSQREDFSYGETYIQGGPRRRMFFRECPDLAPALNKTPLIRWRRDYVYLSSTHMAAPRRLNRPHAPEHLSPTGCLLHFKFISMLQDKVAEEMVRGEHYAGSAEYVRYNAVLSNVGGQGDSLFYAHSERYRDSHQLRDLGLMSFGQWF